MIKLLFFIITFSQSVNAQSLQIVTSDFSPYQTMKEGKVAGITTEIVRAVLKNADMNGEIKMYPWARAYRIAQREPNLIIYSILRTPEREKLFKWIGVIAPYNVYFWKMKDRDNIKIKNFEEAKKFTSGGVFDDVKADFLLKNGFVSGQNIDLVSNDTLNIKKMFAGRIDIFPYDEWSLPYKVQDAELDFKKLQKLIKVDGISNDLYMAASLTTTDATVKKLQNALEEFKKTKEYRNIKTHIK